MSLRSAVVATILAASIPGDIGAQGNWTPATVDDVSSVGWSLSGLDRVRAFADSIGTAAMIVITETSTVVSMGAIERRFRAHSLRKSFLSGLLGIAVGRGQVDLEANLDELGIDDREGLSETEQTASVLHLMQARSGVYHPAASETSSMSSDRPSRGSHEPGTYWHYNNWDFNVLGTIYTRATGARVGDAFDVEIALPLEMQDFSPADVRYQMEPEKSLHASYKFRVSARDLARFGLLYLNGGKWGGRQLIPAEWIAESTRTQSRTGERGTKSGYGLMWWVTAPGDHGLPVGSYTASGSGGQRLTVIPSLRTVVVHVMDTDAADGPRIGTSTYNELLRVLLDARIH